MDHEWLDLVGAETYAPVHRVRSEVVELESVFNWRNARRIS